MTSARERAILPRGKPDRSGIEGAGDPAETFLCFVGFGDEAIIDPGLPVFDDRFAPAAAAAAAAPDTPEARGPANVAFARYRRKLSTSS